MVPPCRPRIDQTIYSLLVQVPRPGAEKQAVSTPSPISSTTSSSLGLGGAGSGRQVLELKRTMEKLQQEVASLRNKPAGGGGGGSGGGGAPAAPRKRAGGGGGGKKAMTFEEKRDLSLNINKLDNEGLIQALTPPFFPALFPASYGYFRKA